METKRSPLAPELPETLPLPKGVTFYTATGPAGEQGGGKEGNILLIDLPNGTQAAGVFTQSQTAAAPVEWCRTHLKASGRKRGCVVNSGNANAFTGDKGPELVASTAQHAAAHLTRMRQPNDIQVKPEDILIASTGVIGEPLPANAFHAALDSISATSPVDGFAAAKAITTTDTFFKVQCFDVPINTDETVRIFGMAKGAGMIAPNMATMLAFIFTDAAVPAPVLQSWLEEFNAVSFNSIVVDGDESTNDSLIAFATGRISNPQSHDSQAPIWGGIRRAIRHTMQSLAIQIVRDGEGAKKLITIRVRGAKSEDAAKRVAMEVARSPLVKTAIAGEDANWGRIVMAIGKAGVPIDQKAITISIGGQDVASEGGRVDHYDEAAVTAHMKGSEIDIDINLGQGVEIATVWTCDLTHDYISINADYRS